MSTNISSAFGALPARAGGVSSSVNGPATEPAPAFQEQLRLAVREEKAAQSVTLAEQKLPPAKEVDQEKVDKAVSHINSYVQNLQRDLQFEVNLELGHTVISVIDHETKEVIRQIPPEEAVERAKRLQEHLNGMESPGGLLLKEQA